MLPTDLFEDYSVETVETVPGIFIPLASIDGLSSAEANATTGDGREVLRCLLTTAYGNFASLPSAPSRLDINYAENLITESRRQVLITAAFNVVVPTSSYEMEPEPV